MLSVPIDTFSGLVLLSSTHEMFSAYYAIHRTWGPSRLEDLHIGGGIMWIGGDTLMVTGMIPVVVNWVRREDERARQLDAELDAAEAAESASPAGPTSS